MVILNHSSRHDSDFKGIMYFLMRRSEIFSSSSSSAVPPACRDILSCHTAVTPAFRERERYIFSRQSAVTPAIRGIFVQLRTSEINFSSIHFMPAPDSASISFSGDLPDSDLIRLRLPVPVRASQRGSRASGWISGLSVLHVTKMSYM